MGCCGQDTTGAGAAAVDTGKRVNYTKGMLLGVDDFVQEQAWGIARRHELAREVLGYGTVRGLQVLIDPGAPRVRVTPGMAWMPSGTPVCVPSEQCCDINAWLRKHWGELPAAVNQLPQPAPLTVYVVLCYDSCLTDTVPVPGEPCRSEEDLTAASRIADCFTLELRLAPPDPVEENAVRDFADWLARVPVDTSSPPLSEQAFLDQLRAAAHDWLEPSSPHPADYMFGSPPAALGSTDALLRAALRLWVTELRPLWRARYGCGPTPAIPGGPDDAVLLAALDLRVHSADQSADADVVIVEDARPLLLSLRMVQELITQNPAPEPASSVVAAGSFGLAPVVGTDTAYARADHSHGTPVLPPLVGDAAGPIGGNQVVGLRGAAIEATAPVLHDVLARTAAGTWAPTRLPQPGAALPAALAFGNAGSAGTQADYARRDHVHPLPTLPPLPTVDGDATGELKALRVVGLRGRPVADVEPDPAGGQALVFDATQGWMPKKIDAGGGAGPAAATQAPPGLAFGGIGTVGTRIDYARGDHSHTLPVLPALGGDLSGSLGGAFVDRLQKVPLKAAEPQAGDALVFDGKAWVPGAGIGPVAAGQVTVALQTSGAAATIDFSTGPAKAGATGNSGTQLACEVLCSGIADAKGARTGFVVKLTSMFNIESPHFPMLNGAVTVVDAETIRFVVVLMAGKAFPAGKYQFQFEVSRFAPFKAP